MKREWRVAGCLQDLRTELNRVYPDREKPDGTIGDDAHSKRKSSHNPDEHGVVRGLDVRKKGTDPWAIVARLVALGKAGDPRLGGGYVIHDGLIWSDKYGWRQRPYDGLNAHATHVHVSCTDDPQHYDARGSWGLRRPKPNPTPPRPEAKVLYIVKTPDSPVQYLTDGITRRRLEDVDELNFWREKGAKPETWSGDLLSSIPLVRA